MVKLVKPNLYRRKQRAAASAAYGELICAAVKVNDAKAVSSAASSKKSSKKK